MRFCALSRRPMRASDEDTMRKGARKDKSTSMEPISKIIPAAFIALVKAETGSDLSGYPLGSRSNLPGSILGDADKIHSN